MLLSEMEKLQILFFLDFCSGPNSILIHMKERKREKEKKWKRERGKELKRERGK